MAYMHFEKLNSNATWEYLMAHGTCGDHFNATSILNCLNEISERHALDPKDIYMTVKDKL